MARLPEEKREVFRMVHELEMSLRDAADALNIPEGTVKSRLHYARRQLARDWRELEAGS
jgi:RNA polymerase sigma-70 factor (ECF subfamily)